MNPVLLDFTLILIPVINTLDNGKNTFVSHDERVRRDSLGKVWRAIL